MYNVKINDYGNGLVKITHYHMPIRIRDCSHQLQKVTVRTLESVKRANQSSLSRAKQKVYDYAMSNEWEWFITITFSPEYQDRTNYEECSKRLKYWIDETRRYSSDDFKYIAIPEYHKDGKSFHFHILASGMDDNHFIDSVHVTKSGLPIYNLQTYKWGFTTATRITDSKRATTYITKYFTKELANHTKGQKKYWSSRNLKKPATTKILDIDKYIINGLENEEYLFESKIIHKKEIEINQQYNKDKIWANTITYYLIETNT